MKILMNKTTVEITKDNPATLVGSKINARGREDKDDAFFVGDLGDVIRKFSTWNHHLPRVKPFYAVKCNDDPGVLETLARLGTGFDCASKMEIKKIMHMKVAPSRVIYANPCKQTSHIRYAAKHQVAMMTFDNEPELHKVKAVYPDAELVIRILPPDESKSQCQLGMKYGCHPKHTLRLLYKAKELGLNVTGVSFHVGSGCYDVTAFTAAVASARTVFDMGEQAGYHFDLLDIGGGFPGQKSAKLSFEEICQSLRPALDMYFPESMGVRLIAEPGRFFVASAFTLAVNVIAKRAVCRDGHQGAEDNEPNANDEPQFMYYVNDGVYGSFNCLLFDHAKVEALLVNPEEYEGQPRFTSSIWGPTCDGLDCIREQCQLPELDLGEWLIFKDMGAYTMCAASNFNGMPKPRCYYVMQDQHRVHVASDSIGRRDAAEAFLPPQMKSGHDVSAVEVDTQALTAELAGIDI